jgi:hypothetical protein
VAAADASKIARIAIMLTKDEAMEKMRCHLKALGWDPNRTPHSITLITRELMLKGEAADHLKRVQPKAWEYIDRTHRDHWSIFFETGFQSPYFQTVRVDAETGEVTVEPINSAWSGPAGAMTKEEKKKGTQGGSIASLKG